MSTFALSKLDRAEWCEKRLKLNEGLDFDRMMPAFGFFLIKDCRVVDNGFVPGMLTLLRMCLRSVYVKR